MTTNKLPAVSNTDALQDSNDETWEHNHDKICSAINKVIQASNRMPSKAEIAKETGLSRLTVRNHMNEYQQNPLRSERQERYKVMEQTLFTILYKKAVQGDVNAIKFYFEATGLLNRNTNNVVETQHNYIQINNLKLSQEEVQKLSPENLLQIEAIIKNSASLVRNEQTGKK